ncbi:MAG: DUF3194 domain-containing protein [Euryarchaeota archaeon]
MEKIQEAALRELYRLIPKRDLEDVDVRVVIDGDDVDVRVEVTVHPLSELSDEEIREAVEKAADAAIRAADRLMKGTD